MKLNVPDILKVKLVDDWEAVTKNCQVCCNCLSLFGCDMPNEYFLALQLVSLPRKPTVEELLHEYGDYVRKLPRQPIRASTVLPTIISGLRLYFDRAIGTNLLYRFERPQYLEQRKRYITGSHVKYGEEKEMSQVYGAEHLLRMIGMLHSFAPEGKVLIINLPIIVSLRRWFRSRQWILNLLPF